MNRIAIFGEPGSGKTTTAEKLSKLISSKKIEASRTIIYPIALNYPKLPSEKKLLEKLELIHKIKTGKVTRDLARETFVKLQKTYSPDFIAQALHKLFVDKPKYKNIIFSGLRGLDNARYCRLHNDLVVYLKSSREKLVRRLMKDRNYTRRLALTELKQEQSIYKTSQIEKIANLVIDTDKNSPTEVAKLIKNKLVEWNQSCKRCVNTGRNPSITFDKNGYCNICSAYIKNFDPLHLKKELQFLKSFIGTGKDQHDVIVGISGGKDSTATLYTVKKMGFNPLAVTLDLGYLPKTTIPRSRYVASLLKTDYEVIDIRNYIRKIDLESYKKTVALYEEPFTLETKLKFQNAYSIGREHYSIKCKHSPIFVRSCQLCRRMVIRAYYQEAMKRGMNAMILGINEWTNLSAAQNNRKYKVSGIRKLQPDKNSPPVFVFHLPFLLQRNIKDTKKILARLGWNPPRGEDLIESNSNSCLLAILSVDLA